MKASKKRGFSPGDLIKVREDAYVSSAFIGKIGLLLETVKDERFKGCWVVLIDEKRRFLYPAAFRIVKRGAL